MTGPPKRGTETGTRLVFPMGTEYLCECSPQSSHRQIRTRLPVGIVHGLALLPWPAFGTNRVFQTQYDKTRMGCRWCASTMTALERLEIDVLTEHMHPPDRSVQDVINEPSRCYPRCSWHETIHTRSVIQHQ